MFMARPPLTELDASPTATPSITNARIVRPVKGIASRNEDDVIDDLRVRPAGAPVRRPDKGDLRSAGAVVVPPGGVEHEEVEEPAEVPDTATGGCEPADAGAATTATY
jgi:hypothetical protein